MIGEHDSVQGSVTWTSPRYLMARSPLTVSWPGRWAIVTWSRWFTDLPPRPWPRSRKRLPVHGGWRAHHEPFGM